MAGHQYGTMGFWDGFTMANTVDNTRIEIVIHWLAYILENHENSIEVHWIGQVCVRFVS
jgi:hypothetical protein